MILFVYFDIATQTIFSNYIMQKVVECSNHISNKTIRAFVTQVLTAMFLILTYGIMACKGPDVSYNRAEDRQAVETAIHNVFGWAVNKDFDLFFHTIADDSNFISVTPYNRVKFGSQAVKQDSAFWGSPHFKAIRHEIRDLHIHFSTSGDVAWFYGVVDDINEWRGQPANWCNTRWTGVLEKREGEWRVVQQHFSWASD
ncbi:nuclear transport factor 2 family protein [candidate division KSB1 bacterium]|nr:nuclear transport factor 2 family protein [candidate division KSB1 bacterium]